MMLVVTMGSLRHGPVFAIAKGVRLLKHANLKACYVLSQKSKVSREGEHEQHKADDTCHHNRPVLVVVEAELLRAHHLASRIEYPVRVAEYHHCRGSKKQADTRDRAPRQHVRVALAFGVLWSSCERGQDCRRGPEGNRHAHPGKERPFNGEEGLWFQAQRNLPRHLPRGAGGVVFRVPACIPQH